MSPLYLHNIQLSLWWLIRKGKRYHPKSARGFAAIHSLGRDYISFWVDTGNSENDYVTFLHCRHIVVWFVTSLCHIIVFLAVLLAASSADVNFHIILLKIWKGKKRIENFLLLAWVRPSYRSIHPPVMPGLLVGEGFFAVLFSRLWRLLWDCARLCPRLQNCVMLGQKLSSRHLSPRSKELSSVEECTLHNTCK